MLSGDHPAGDPAAMPTPELSCFSASFYGSPSFIFLPEAGGAWFEGCKEDWRGWSPKSKGRAGPEAAANKEDLV